MTRSSLVSIVIVNWNGLNWLPECFVSLEKQNYKNIEIILVDNASTDGSIEWVRKRYPKTIICKNSINTGFAEGNNIGFRCAKGEYVVFLNNDTKVTKAFLTELLQSIEMRNDVAGAQSKILLMDHPDTLDSIGAFLTPTGFLYHYGFNKKDSKLLDKEIEVYSAKGACMIFKKDALDKVAVNECIFDPDFFAYVEESDLCHRIWLSGKRVIYAPRSVIFHKMGGTSINMNNAFIQFHSFKNRIRSYIKNFEMREMVKILSFHIPVCTVYAIFALLKGNHELFGAIVKALLWNMTNIHKTLTLRKLIQNKIRTIPDNAFLPRVVKHPSIRYYIGLAQGKVIQD